MDESMKAMEAPEKIYIPTILAANTVRYKEEGDIEYNRTDAFMKKAKKWFEQQPETYDANGVRVYGEKDFEDFKNYMKGE